VKRNRVDSSLVATIISLMIAWVLFASAQVDALPQVDAPLVEDHLLKLVAALVKP